MAKLPIVALDEVDSTSDEARRQAAQGSPGGPAPPFWVRADRQTKGRGRQGRGWIGLPGNLMISGVYHLACPPGEAAQLSFAAALAVADVLDAHVDPRRVAFKWPNDVKLDRLKVAGVLLEGVSRGRGVELVVGVGLNLADAASMLRLRRTWPSAWSMRSRLGASAGPKPASRRCAPRGWRGRRALECRSPPRRVMRGWTECSRISTPKGGLS
jgi:biotin-[acetyl-CoA-carboxylase] ligase BirA-like protein